MHTASFVSESRLPEFKLWRKLEGLRVPLSFDLEITARCNNDCRHCYINVPASDAQARHDELSLAEIGSIADQAVALGSLWCLVTGGEPLLRDDFVDIYLALKNRGLLVTVFTNACLVTDEHVALFKKYPPRDIEVTVYGATEETYERVTRRPGSYAAFHRGLNALLDAGVKVRLKAMALRSNVSELPAIAEFCRKHTMDYFRFDPLLHLRYDGNPERNEDINAERLLPAEIAAIEQADDERAMALDRGCDKLIAPGLVERDCNHLFSCGAGNGSFTVGYDGLFRLCSDLCHPDCSYNLRSGPLAQAWNELVPRVRDLRSSSLQFLDRCRNCPIVNLCLWCPAHAYLETGHLDGFSDYFCEVAHARAEGIQNRRKQELLD